MINELYNLSQALDKSGIISKNWHKDYNSLPKYLCIRIVVSNKHISRLEIVEGDALKNIRKYGSNQGTFPAFSICPLFRVQDDDTMRDIAKMKSGEIPIDLEKIRTWCTTENWEKNQKNKYHRSVNDCFNKLRDLLLGNQQWNVLDTLYNEISDFTNEEYFFSELNQSLFRLLKENQEVNFALSVLFNDKKSKKSGNDKGNAITVLLDCEKLVELGYPTVSQQFTNELNRRLLALQQYESNSNSENVDAFGVKYIPSNDPMPSVKLGCGFELSIRTMFEDQHCQSRYGVIGSKSYPLSSGMQIKLKSALEWLGGSKEQENITWKKIAKNEVLLAFTSQLPKTRFSQVNIMKGEKTFKECAKEFLANPDAKQSDNSQANRVSFFILKKIDKAQTKLVYTRVSSPQEIEQCSNNWCNGMMNVPWIKLVNDKYVPFPLDVAEIINCKWKSDGGIISGKNHSVTSYHGVDLFFASKRLVDNDLALIVKDFSPAVPWIGKQIINGQKITDATKDKIRNTVALTGFLLYAKGLKKEEYMQSFAFLYGQLLKVSDELHLMYCKIVRENNSSPIVSQLVGGSFYSSAAEFPIRTISLLAQRMNVYINWAKTYRFKKEEESWKAGWLLRIYENIAEQIAIEISNGKHERFTDDEKALLFLGFMAGLPKKSNDSSVDGGSEDE